VTTEESTTLDSKALELVNRILKLGVEGGGLMTSARATADEHLAAHGDRDAAVERLVASHIRIVGVTGFAAGVGGFAALPLTLPSDIAALYAMSVRCAAGVAHLRGYDIDSDEVRSVVLVTLLGSAGAKILGEAGVKIGQKAAMAALQKLPGRVLIEINKKVGFRLLTKFGEKGAINLCKVVPVVGGVVGAGVNAATMRTVATYAKVNFPAT
jgi:hypothetical protein